MSDGKGRWPRSFKEANDERHALIAKEYAGGLEHQLSAEEIFRLHILETMVGAWMNYKHPSDYRAYWQWLRETRGDEMLKALEKLEADEEITRWP